VNHLAPGPRPTRRRHARPGVGQLRVRADHDPPLLAAWLEAEPDLRRLASAYGVERGRVDDCLQDVYLSALESGERPTDAAGLRRWLFRVAINRCRLEHRHRRRWQSAWEGLRRAWAGWRGGDPAEAMAGGEQRVALRQALAQLEPETRMILVLRYYSGLNSTDIGQMLELSPSTVRGQLRVARQRLAEMLRAAGVEGEQDVGVRS
jgi:RNA polymerase sigma-70 factor, ECF subfamily